MGTTVSHQSLIREARKEIRALKPGRGIRRDTWFFVQELLLALAGYLPDPWPSERTLAKKLGRDKKAIHRSLCHAREWGLVVTTPRPMEYGWRPGQTYRLVCLSEPLRAVISRGQIQGADRDVSKSSSSKKTETGSPTEIPLSRAAPDGQEPFMPRFDERDEFSSPAIGEDPRSPLGEPTVIQAKDPAVYLARRFDSKWARLLKTQPDLVGIRGSSRGMAIGYLRKAMLDTLSPEHVEAYMDAFIEAVANGDAIVKDGQFAFERFTHWWGREPVEDPALAQRDRDLVQYVRQRSAEAGPPVPFLDRFPKTS